MSRLFRVFSCSFFLALVLENRSAALLQLMAAASLNAQ